MIQGDYTYSMPKWLWTKPLMWFCFSFAFVTFLWFDYAMPLNFAIVSVLSVLLFCIGGQVLFKRWCKFSEKRFVKEALFFAVLIRVVYSVYTYYFNIGYHGAPIGETGDTVVYVALGEEAAECFRHFNVNFIQKWFDDYHIAIDDFAEPIFLGILYLLSGSISDVFLPFMVKSVLGAITCILMYKIAQRHFGDYVGRLTALFCVLNPNMIWWCASMMKEAEMIFFVVLFLNIVDRMLMPNGFSLLYVIVASLFGFYLFMFRSALGAVAFLSVFATLALISQRIVAFGKKIIISVMVVVALVLGMGDTIVDRSGKMFQQVQEDSQEENMNWRAQRKDKAGNTQTFAKYAGAAVFAPLIFTIPFPTLSAASVEQFSQMQMSGGNFIKNIFSFFVVFALFVLLTSGQWRKHVLLICFLCGYLLVLVMSGYAQSGRFHMPIWPLEMMFAAVGVSMIQKKQVKWFSVVLFVEFLACIAWQWFKLKGRGLI